MLTFFAGIDQMRLFQPRRFTALNALSNILIFIILAAAATLVPFAVIGAAFVFIPASLLALFLYAFFEGGVGMSLAVVTLLLALAFWAGLLFHLPILNPYLFG